MSGVCDQKPCPICGKEMTVYMDWKPIDYSSGECIHCGFCLFPQVIQMNLKDVNELRASFNEDCDSPEDEKLKPLTKKDLKKYAKDIKNFW